MEKNFFRGVPASLSFVCLLLVGITATCYAQEDLSDSMKAEVRKVSDLMYSQGNLSYIDAAALSDGIIRPDTHYELHYHNDTLTISDKALPEQVRTRYMEQLHKFLSIHAFQDFSTRSDGLKLADVFDEKSTFRTRRDEIRNGMVSAEDKRSKDNSARTDALIRLLNEDKLIDFAEGYHVKLSPEGLYVNGKRLGDKATSRYVAALHRAVPGSRPGETPYIEVQMTLAGDKDKK